MLRRFRQLQWLVRRLSRISLQEWPYRLHGAVRALAQSAGLFTAGNVPPTDAGRPRGAPWVRVPGAMTSVPPSLQRQVDAIMQGRIEILGLTVCIDARRPQWQQDPVSNLQVKPGFGLFLDFRHMRGGFDIKFLWELNRHLWWVPLAQAYAIGGDARYVRRLHILLRTWLDQCPYAMGPNWSSPVEHGIRLINWSMVWHLLGGWDASLFAGEDGERLREDWLRSIYQHMHFASSNYSLYSSADNHLIGEAAGVFVGARTWNCWPECERWRKQAGAILEQQIDRQFSTDGVNLEQSLNYQKFSLEFLLSAALCARAGGGDFSARFWARIDAAMTFMAAMLPANDAMPAIGDSDDGCVLGLAHDKDECLYRALVGLGGILLQRQDLIGKAGRCGRHTPWLCRDAAPLWRRLRTRETGHAAQTWRQALPQDFPAGGYVILGDALHTAAETRIVFDTGDLGLNRVAGHGHADALALCLSHRGMPFLIDSGTYCYNAAPAYRRYFRGTQAHNTMTVDGRDQAEYGGSFLWLSDVHANIEASLFSPSLDRVRAGHDGYMRLRDPARHVRELSFDKSAMLLQVKDMLASKAQHEVAIYWHFHPDCAIQILPDRVLAQNGSARLVLRWSNPAFAVQKIVAEEGAPFGWISTRFNARTAATTIVMRGTLGGDAHIVSSLQLRHAHHRSGLREPYQRAAAPDYFGLKGAPAWAGKEGMR